MLVFSKLRQHWRQLLVVSLGSLLSWTLLTGSAVKEYPWRLPSWVPLPVVPADNPMSVEKVELGRHLFYDTRLSINNSMSCATCHHQDKAFTDGLAVAAGVTGQIGSRSAMSLTNVAYLPTLTWANPQIKSLEVQALVPIFGEHPIEMGMAGLEKTVFDRLKADKLYQKLFKQAFPDEASKSDEVLYSLQTLTKALASFERSLLSFNSPYDLYKYGNHPNAISPAAKRGEALFFGEKLECYHCHGSFNFNDNIHHVRMPFAEQGFHNTGLYNTDGKGGYPRSNPGISEFTGEAADMGKFRTASLRNIAVTAPYMHDGSIATLSDVIRKHYALAGKSGSGKFGVNPLRSELIAGFEIDDNEVQDLIAFLQTLTDTQFLNNPAHSNPWLISQKR